jgi:hypothetical protein
MHEGLLGVLARTPGDAPPLEEGVAGTICAEYGVLRDAGEGVLARPRRERAVCALMLQ